MAAPKKAAKKPTTRGRKPAAAKKTTGTKKAAPKKSTAAPKRNTATAPLARPDRKTPTARSHAKAKGSEVTNPFDKGTPRYKAAALLLKPGLHSFDELKEAAGGNLSTRTMGAIIVELESAGARFRKSRPIEYGMCYEYDAKAPLIGKHDGPEATGERTSGRKAATPAKKAPAKTAKKTTKKTTTARKKAPAKKAAVTKKPLPKKKPRRK